jgi:hypothetical protein
MGVVYPSTMDKTDVSIIENVGMEKKRGDAHSGSTTGGVNLFTDGAVVLIPTPSPDPKGMFD